MKAQLEVRNGKTVYDAKGNVVGVSGQLLPLDAPIRESDACKVVLVDADDGRVLGMDVQSFDKPTDIQATGDATVEVSDD